MTKRIFRSVALVALSMVMVSVALVMVAVYRYAYNIQLQQLRIQTEFVAQAVMHEGTAYFEDLEVEGCRVTWIDLDGTVLYDSKTDAVVMENHMEREEFREAVDTGRGESARYSSTILERSLYCALRLEDGTVVRLAMAQETVLKVMLKLMPSVSLILLGAILLSFLLAGYLSKKIISPLNDLDLDNPLANKDYEEVRPLLQRIGTQQRQLRDQRDELRCRQDEFAAVTDNMTEGLVLLDTKGTILSLNNSAAAIFSVERHCEGGSVFDLQKIPDISALVENVLAGRQMEVVATVGEKNYQLSANPVVSNGAVTGAVLLIFDITEKEMAESIRREFTANVSHELKTPLHSISGYAELLKNGIVQEKDVVPFAQKIYAEAQRMTRLVEDIIHLSRLDEGSGLTDMEELDLYSAAAGVLQRLESVAQQRGVQLSLAGEKAYFRGISRLLDSIIYNLCDNAIKYNKENGSVAVSVKNEVSAVVLTVADTGIGIPSEHQSRIFERFYRVDKSRSKEMGGTGLGLSIVKRAARIHNAKIDVESMAGVGTTVSVRFPK
ncbi:MAG: PAS domain-containing sensor histidine kinase [Oscillospiraceae bacterium]|nr:PAS domain-containing sensor histidine kinase [Oscillospiraceae bacterium]